MGPCRFSSYRGPDRIRTGAFTLRGWCPRPLDDGIRWCIAAVNSILPLGFRSTGVHRLPARREGFEPPTICLEDSCSVQLS